MMIRRLLISLLGLWGVNAAWAQGDSVEGGYVGFGLGQFDYEEQDFGLTLEDTTLAYKVYGGYRFNETFSFEASYGQTDDLELSLFGFPFQADYELLEVRGLAHLKAFLIGLGYWDADISASAFGFSVSDSDSGASIVLGGQWELDQWAIRAEYEVFDTESTVEAFTIGLGVHYRF